MLARPLPNRRRAACIAPAILLACLSVCMRAQGGEDNLDWTTACAAGQDTVSRRLLPEHHEVAAVIGAMIDGDAVLMYLGQQRLTASLATQDLLSLQVTFAAQDAELRRVAGLVKICSRKRASFVPRDPDHHVTLRLDQVTLKDLLNALSTFGDVRLPGLQLPAS
jgi:hypothetical protein